MTIPEDARIRALDHIFELVVLLSEDMRGDLEGLGLTPARAHALWILADRGPSTQRVLAEALGVTARNVTGLVDALVATGFVTREAHPSDRRAVLVSFTPHGAETMARMKEQQRELAGQLFADMPQSRFTAFTEAMSGIVATIRAEVARQDLRPAGPGRS